MTSFSEIQQPTGMPTAVLRPEGALPAQPDRALDANRPPENIGQTTPAFQNEDPSLKPFPTPQEMIALGGTPTEDTRVFTPDDIRELNNMSSINPDQATDRRPVTLQSLARPFPAENLPPREEPTNTEAQIDQALAETVRQAEQLARTQQELNGLKTLSQNPEFQKNVKRGWFSVQLPDASKMIRVMGEISPEVHVSPSIVNIEDYRADRASTTPPETSPANSPTDISKAQ